MLKRLLVAVLVVGSAPQVLAQVRVKVPSARPGQISGVVTDTLGNIVDSAEVILALPRRRTIADSDGRFHFDSLQEGKYTIHARHVGFHPASLDVEVGPRGASVGFGMIRLPRSLPTVVTSAVRGGISGIVAIAGEAGDTLRVLEGAKVTVVGSSRRATTDASGAFQIAVPTGKHMVNVQMKGYAAKQVSVKVPPDSGRRILVWLSPGIETGLEKGSVEAYRERMLRFNPVYSQLITREDILRMNFTEGTQLQNFNASHPTSDTCSVRIAGSGEKLPMWVLKAADVEMFERYEAKPPRQDSRAVVMTGNYRRPKLPECDTYIAWLRK